MSFFFTKAIEKIASGTIRIDATSSTKLWIAVLKRSSLCYTSPSTALDVDTVSAISPLGEVSTSGTNYTRLKFNSSTNTPGDNDQPWTVTVDDTNNRVKFTPVTTTWTGIVSGSDSSDPTAGLLIYYDADDDGDAADDASNIPVAFISQTSTGTLDGSYFNGTMTITWPSGAIIGLPQTS